MSFFKKKYSLVLLALLIIAVLIAPSNFARAEKYGCMIKGQCRNVEALDTAAGQAACARFCTEAGGTSGSCPLIGPCPEAPGSVAEGDCVPGANGREVCKLTNPIGSTEVSEIIATVIKVLLGIIGGLTVLMFVWGGFQWLTSAGSPEKVKSGSQTMIWAVIGVMIVFASYVLLSTFLDFLTGKAT